MSFISIPGIPAQISLNILLYPVLLTCFWIFILVEFKKYKFFELSTKYFIIAFLYRTFLLFILFSISHKYTEILWGFIDDRTYSQFASGVYEIDKNMINYYHFFLKYVYIIFSQNTYIGRGINIFLSSISIFPLSVVLDRLGIVSKKTIRITLKLYTFLPFEAVFSLFEIKDLLILFILLLYSVVTFEKVLNSRKFVLRIFEIAFLSFVAEGLRSLLGFLMLLIFLINLGKNSHLRKEVFIILISLFLCLLLFINKFNIYDIIIEDYNDYLKYTKWIFTQIGETSIYRFFIILDPKQFYKFPISFLAYLIYPLPTSLPSINVPFMFSIGKWLKLLSIPLVLLGLMGLPICLKRLKSLSLIFVIPLLTISALNFTNYRQGFPFYVPLIYSSFSLWLDRFYLKKSRKEGIKYAKIGN